MSKVGKGSRSERELFQELWGRGFAVMRSPASGSGRRHPQPDLLASDGDRIVGIEVKSTSGDPVYIPKEEIEKLEEFCEKFGCVPLLGARFDRHGWVFSRPEDCQETENSYKIDVKEAGLWLGEGEGFKKQETIPEGRT